MPPKRRAPDSSVTGPDHAEGFRPASSLEHTFDVITLKGNTLSVAVRLDLPACKSEPNCVGVVLAHGASGNIDTPHMRAYSRGLVARGLTCLSFNASSTSVPHRMAIMEGVLRAASTWGPTSHLTHWVLAGHSMGARVAVGLAHQWTSGHSERRNGGEAGASTQGAEGPAREEALNTIGGKGRAKKKGRTKAKDEGAPEPTQTAGSQGPIPAVVGCVLLSYPLHAPGKPDQLRDDPLIRLRLPLLFVRGTRDEFSTKGPWEALLPRLTSPKVQVHEVEGGGHALLSTSVKRGGTAKIQRAKHTKEGPSRGEADEGAEEGSGKHSDIEGLTGDTRFDAAVAEVASFCWALKP